MANVSTGPKSPLAAKTDVPGPDKGARRAGGAGAGTGADGAEMADGSGDNVSGGTSRSALDSLPTWKQLLSILLGIAAFGVAVAAISKAGPGSIGLWLIGLICLFLGIVVVIPVLAGADWKRRDAGEGKAEKTGGFTDDPERLLRMAIRAAAVACLLVVVGVELELVRNVVQKDGFASTLLVPAVAATSTASAAPAAPSTSTPAADSATPVPAGGQAAAPATAGAVRPAPRAHPGGITWPGAFVLSVLIVAMTVIVSFTLYTIWRVARED